MSIDGFLNLHLFYDSCIKSSDASLLSWLYGDNIACWSFVWIGCRMNWGMLCCLYLQTSRICLMLWMLLKLQISLVSILSASATGMFYFILFFKFSSTICVWSCPNSLTHWGLHFFTAFMTYESWTSYMFRITRFFMYALCDLCYKSVLHFLVYFKVHLMLINSVMIF